MPPIDAHRFIQPASTPSVTNKHVRGRAAQGNAVRGAAVQVAAPLPRPLPLQGMRNGPVLQVAPRAVAQGSSVNACINQLFERVRQQERGLGAIEPEVISCTRLPGMSGVTGDFLIAPYNAVDCLLRMVNARNAGKVSIINPADSRHRGGGLGVEKFRHTNMPAEETLCVLGKGAKAGLDIAEGYPLGPEQRGKHQLYSTGLQLRHTQEVAQQLRDAAGVTPRERLEAQRDILLAAPFAASTKNSPTYDMISIAAIDRRDHPHFDADAVYNGMLRQFAHAMVTARQRGVDTFIMSLPGSGLFSMTSRENGATADRLYQQALACAAVDAVRFFSAGLERVVMPSHGRVLDALINQYAKHRQRVPEAISRRYQGHASTPAAASPTPVKPQVQPEANKQPKLELIERSMGDLPYKVEREKVDLKSASPVVDALGGLLGNGRHASLRRVHGLQARTDNTEAYWFHRRDPDPKIGRALVSVLISPGERQIFEVMFSRYKLPALAGKAASAPWR